MTAIRHALVFSLIERYAVIALGLVSYVLIARLLTPEEIGIYSVTAALVGVAQVIREFGIGSYLIQAEKLDQRELDTALGLALAAGATMFGLGLLAAPWAATFYRDPRIASILLIISLNFLILPFCSIGQSLLRREMRFKPLMFSNIWASLVGFVVTIGLALASFGPASLAWGAVATNLVTAVGCWLALSGATRPRRLAFGEWRPIVRYGRQSTVAGIFTTGASDINDLGVGRILGLAPVAMLSRAMGLINLLQRDVLGAVRNVAYPAFSKLHREGKPLEPDFVKSTAAVTALSWPYYGFIALYPLESLRLLAGPQWDAAVPLVLAFAAAGACISICTLAPTLILAVGRVDLISRADIAVSCLRVTFVLGSALLFKSLLAVALAYLLGFAIAPFIFFFFKQKCVPTDWPALRTMAGRSLLVSSVTLSIPAIASLSAGWGRTQPMNTLLFTAVGLATLTTWLMALRWCHHPLADDPLYKRFTARMGLR
jgi:O-antigen/teichoic acid export membrane protein